MSVLKRTILFCLCFLFFHVSFSISAENLDKGVDKILVTKAFGDFNEMTERRIIRALVPYSKTFYFLDGAKERGTTYEMVKEFEKFVNSELKTKHLKVHLVIIPTDRDQLLSKLVEGAGDIAAGNLTVTENRRKIVDFAAPMGGNVNEIIITGPGSEPITSIDDLSGKVIHVRKSSSYYDSLLKVNKKFESESKPLITIEPVSTHLEDEDLLEMVNAGIISMIVVDDYKARFWAQVFPDIVLHHDVVINRGGEIAWAIRKNSPELKAVINRFVKEHKKGTLFGNVVFNRYLKNTGYVKNNISNEGRQKFTETVDLFKKYGEQYSFDWLMLMALAYQESTLDQAKKSAVGAVGVMQILPSTAQDKNVAVDGIEEIEPNVHAGTKYIRFMVDRYFDDPELDDLNRGLLAFASYNAGPAKISRLRKEAAEVGLDPNVWFKNVEVIAAKRIGRETVQYVSNIFKYYTAYRLMFAKSEKIDQAKKSQTEKK